MRRRRLTMNGPTGARTEMTLDFDPARIDALMRYLDGCRLPGAVVGIVIHGQIVYRKGFGVASMELPVALVPSMRLRIGSVSKHFTALGYLLLCEENRCTLDDPIASLLPTSAAKSQDVTARQLMSHTSGLRDVFDLTWHFNGTAARVSSSQLISLHAEIEDRNSASGSTWCYNNGGYLILSAVIEHLSGEPLETYLRTRIFEPAGMYDTALERDAAGFVERSATLHTPRADGSFEKAWLGTAMAGEGGLVSTIDDLLRWTTGMDDPVVGSSASWQQLKTPGVLPNGVSTGYGLGLSIGQYRGSEIFSHGGDVMGGSAHMLTLPAAGLAIVVMANRGDVWASQVAENLLDACFAPLPDKGDPCDCVSLSGCFRSASTGRVIELFSKDGRLFASIDGRDVPFAADRSGTLRPADAWAGLVKCALSWSGDPARPTSLRLDEYGHLDELMPVRAVDDARAVTIAGRYRSASLNVSARISIVKGRVLEGQAPARHALEEQARLTFAGPFGSSSYALENIAANIWRARSVESPLLGGVLTFDADRDGFRFSTLRTRAWAFHREE